MARELFERAIDIDPTYFDAYKNIDRLDVRAARFNVLEDRLASRIAEGLDPEGSALQLARLQASRDRPDDVCVAGEPQDWAPHHRCAARERAKLDRDGGLRKAMRAPW